MRHKVQRNRLIQKPDHGRMLQRNLVTSLLLYEEIRTTRKRARVIQPIVDNLITLSKTKSAQLAIRSINTVITDKNASRKLIEVLKERYAQRSSGFTRMKPVGARKGDGAELVDLSLVDKQAPKATVEKKQTKQKIQKKTSPASSDSSESSK
jgi:large subunit ribosomal protein L17